MSRIFNNQINISPCKECSGDSFIRDDKKIPYIKKFHYSCNTCTESLGIDQYQQRHLQMENECDQDEKKKPSLPDHCGYQYAMETEI